MYINEKWAVQYSEEKKQYFVRQLVVGFLQQSFQIVQTFLHVFNFLACKQQAKRLHHA